MSSTWSDEESHRVPPRAVVECIDADLLLYICKFEIAWRYRTSRPEEVDALAVHEWAMKTKKSSLDAEDEEGITQLRKLVCNLGGADGVRCDRLESLIPRSSRQCCQIVFSKAVGICSEGIGVTAFNREFTQGVDMQNAPAWRKVAAWPDLRGSVEHDR